MHPEAYPDPESCHLRFNLLFHSLILRRSQNLNQLRCVPIPPTDPSPPPPRSPDCDPFLSDAATSSTTSGSPSPFLAPATPTPPPDQPTPDKVRPLRLEHFLHFIRVFFPTSYFTISNFRFWI